MKKNIARKTILMMGVLALMIGLFGIVKSQNNVAKIDPPLPSIQNPLAVIDPPLPGRCIISYELNQ